LFKRLVDGVDCNGRLQADCLTDELKGRTTPDPELEAELGGKEES